MDGTSPAFAVIPSKSGFFRARNRRQLSTGQRAMVAAKMANMRQGNSTGSNQHERKAANLPVSSVSQSEAATRLNVSERIVRDAVSIQRESPELAKQVEAGTITVNAAKERIREERKTLNACLTV